MWHQCHNKHGTKRASLHNIIVIFIFFIAVAHHNQGFCVRAFSPSSTQITKMKPYSTVIISGPSDSFTSATSLLMSPGDANNKKEKNEEDDISSVLWKDLDKKPANLIILPIVALFGVDLLLNLAIVVKRSFEYIFFGQAPSTETWW